MMLFVDGFYKAAPVNNAGQWVNSYEEAFEWLTQLKASGWELTSALITDQDECISLPIEAFDGQPIRVHIEQLQLELNQLLAAKPALPTSDIHVNLKEWFLQLDLYYTQLLRPLEQLTVLLDMRLKQISTRPHQCLRNFLLDAYDSRLKRMKRLQQQILDQRYRNRQRLQTMM